MSTRSANLRSKVGASTSTLNSRLTDRRGNCKTRDPHLPTPVTSERTIHRPAIRPSSHLEFSNTRATNGQQEHEQMNMRSRCMTTRRIVSVVGLMITLAACSQDAGDTAGPSVDSVSQAGPDDTPPPEPVGASFTLEPTNPESGAAFAALFDPDENRGGFFLLSKWEGGRWAEPAFLLESDVNQPAPSATPISGEYETDDYDAVGRGPDGLVMPDEIDNGQWRLCTANALNQLCTQLVVGARPSTAPNKSTG